MTRRELFQAVQNWNIIFNNPEGINTRKMLTDLTVPFNLMEE